MNAVRTLLKWVGRVFSGLALALLLPVVVIAFPVLIFSLPAIFSWHGRSFRKQVPEVSDVLARAREVRAIVRRRRERLQDGNYALVLAGGGGKGAYQIGALRALSMFGIKSFSTVAGTSVGAMNGVLVAQEDLRAASQIWWNMEQRRVFEFRVWVYPLAVAARVLFFPVLLARYLLPQLNTRLSTFERRTTHHLCGAGLRVTVEKVVKLVFGLSVLAVLAMAAKAIGVPNLQLLPLVDVVMVEAASWVALLMISIPLVALWMMASFAYDWVTDNLSFLTNSPLQKIVSEQVKRPSLRFGSKQVFATYAVMGVAVRLEERQETVVVKEPHPDEAVDDSGEDIPMGASWHQRFRRWLHDNLQAQNDFRVAPTKQVTVQKPIAADKFIARYANLTSGSYREVVNCVIQSAGLPEAFPRRPVGGIGAVDGGMTDNSPLFPVLCHPGEADTVVVIELSEPASREQWKEQTVRGLAVETNGISETSLEGRHDQVTFQADEYRRDVAACDAAATGVLEKRQQSTDRKTIRVLPIVPSISPGNIVTGTMNFSRKKCRSLMWLGFSDALAAIEAGFAEIDVPKNLGEGDHSIRAKTLPADLAAR